MKLVLQIVAIKFILLNNRLIVLKKFSIIEGKREIIIILVFVTFLHFIFNKQNILFRLIDS